MICYESEYKIISPHIRDRCVIEIDTRASLSDNLRIRIDELVTPKSKRQRGYIFGCIYVYIKQFLYNETHQKFDINTEIHPYHVELFKLDKAEQVSRVLNLGAGPMVVGTSLSAWTAKPTSNYIEWILSFYALKGLYIPEANIYWKERGVRN